MMWSFLLIAMSLCVCNGRPMAAKRELCPEGGGNKNVACDYWRDLGYCSEVKGYADLMEKDCPVSCGICQARPTPPPMPRIIKVNIGECLEAHNSRRELHQAKPLTWDDSLAKDAEEWALNLAKDNIFQHAPFTGSGENIYSAKKLEGKIATCADAVEAWYSEVKNYDFEHPPKNLFQGGPTVGHFTQLVWKSTKKVGVSVVAIQRGFYTKTYIVARYTPIGNVEDQFGREVGTSVMARK